MEKDGGDGETGVRMEQLGGGETCGRVQRAVERDDFGPKRRAEQWEHVRRK